MASKFRSLLFIALFVFAQTSVLQHASTHFQHSHHASCASFLSAENNTPFCAAIIELNLEKPFNRYFLLSDYQHNQRFLGAYFSRAPPTNKLI